MPQSAELLEIDATGTREPDERIKKRELFSFFCRNKLAQENHIEIASLEVTNGFLYGAGRYDNVSGGLPDGVICHEQARIDPDGESNGDRHKGPRKMQMVEADVARARRATPVSAMKS